MLPSRQASRFKTPNSKIRRKNKLGNEDPDSYKFPLSLSASVFPAPRRIAPVPLLRGRTGPNRHYTISTDDMKVADIAKHLEGTLDGDGEIEIHQVASLDSARSGEISFALSTINADLLKQSRASCVIVPESFAEKVPFPVLRVKNPKLAFAKAALFLGSQKKSRGEIHQLSSISENAKIGDKVQIEAFVCVGDSSEIGDETHLHAGVKIGRNVKIGRRCIIHSNVVLRENVTLGDNVILHPGVVLGADGFGYVTDGANGHTKFPQIGSVTVENDVEIGANTCIDRGALGETRIGEGTKIDNLVQIGHNVEIGKRVIIAGQTGISGSSTIEDDVILAGQVGIADHVKVEKGAIIGAKSGVMARKIVRVGLWAGYPIQPWHEYRRNLAKWNKFVKTL